MNGRARMQYVWEDLFDLAERHAETGRTELLITSLDQRHLDDFAHEAGFGHPMRKFLTDCGTVTLVSS